MHRRLLSRLVLRPPVAASPHRLGRKRMSATLKYTFGRLGLFVLVFAMLFPTPLNILVKAMVALLLSAVLGYFLLARWRNEMAEQLSAGAARRAAEKERLRAALAGDEEAAAAGDRVAAVDRPTAADEDTKPARTDSK